MNKAQISQIIISFLLTIFTVWTIFTIGDSARIPTTPCFYIGSITKPAKPCIDSIGWDTYQVIGLFLFIGLTWVWYLLLKKYLFKAKKLKKKRKK